MIIQYAIEYIELVVIDCTYKDGVRLSKVSEALSKLLTNFMNKK